MKKQEEQRELDLKLSVESMVQDYLDDLYTKSAVTDNKPQLKKQMTVHIKKKNIIKEEDESDDDEESEDDKDYRKNKQ